MISLQTASILQETELDAPTSVMGKQFGMNKRRYFSTQVIKLWGSLAGDIVMSTTIGQFQGGLVHQWLLTMVNTSKLRCRETWPLCPVSWPFRATGWQLCQTGY